MEAEGGGRAVDDNSIAESNTITTTTTTTSTSSNGMMIHKKPLSNPLESTTIAKGKGLKKWKRIPRRTPAPTNGGAPLAEEEEDLSRFLKRDSRGIGGGSGLLSATPTPAGGDSDNSEDPSSKSSTAASAPKFRYHNHRSNRAPQPARKISATYPPKQSHNNKFETTKKLRGVQIDKDASYSSVESDLRSSNLFFTQVTNGRHINFDPDNSSEAQASDQQSNDYFKDNGEDEEVSQDDDAATAATVDVSWEPKEEQTHSQRPSLSHDLLAESIVSLQDVHQALEKEIQSFGEIEKEPILLHEESPHHFLLNPDFHYVVSQVYETNSAGRVSFEERRNSTCVPLENELIKMHRKAYILEKQLEEATSMLKVQESRVVELERISSEGGLPKGDSRSSLHSVQEKCREMETELEDLFLMKIEADIECLIMRKTCQKLKVAAEDQIALFEEKKTLIDEQDKNLLHKLRDAETNTVAMKVQVAKLVSCGDLADNEQYPKMHRRICTYALFSSVQLMLLFLAFGILFLRSWPGPPGFVPT